MKTPALLTLLLGLAAAPVFAFESANLIKNGDFSETLESGLPADWRNISHPNYLKQTGSTVELVTEGTQSHLRATKTKPGTIALGEQRVTLDAKVEHVRVAMRVRSADFQVGDIDWQVPGLSYAWLLADNKERQIGPGNWLLLGAPSKRWESLETVLTKPADAIGIKISILGIGWTGQADFDDVTVEPL